jgi:hypothetical protein
LNALNLGFGTTKVAQLDVPALPSGTEPLPRRFTIGLPCDPKREFGIFIPPIVVPNGMSAGQLSLNIPSDFRLETNKRLSAADATADVEISLR